MSYGVAIYGTGKCAENLINYINQDKVKINFFIETKPSKKYYYDKPVLSLKELEKQNFNYNYLIIASMYSDEILEELDNVGLKNEKVIIFNDYYINYFYAEQDLNYKLEKFKHKKNTVIALGLSYTRDAIVSEFYEKEILNLSYSSQDLQADYEILRYLEDENLVHDLENVILGLGYYSFNHDLGKTKFKNIISRYLKVTSDQSRLSVIDESYKYFKEKCSVFLLEKTPEEAESIISNKFHSEKINEQKIIEGIEIAKKHSKMNRPETRNKNLFYLKNILEICERNSIKLIVTIFPTNENYYKYISNRCKEEFYNDLNSLRIKHKFKVLDLFMSNDFYPEDFWDTSHLNVDGAKKMVKLIDVYLH